MEIGKQQAGSSHYSIKQMALKALASLTDGQFDSMADIGSGTGTFAMEMKAQADHVVLLDASPPAALPQGFTAFVCDLNNTWPLPHESVSLAVALEVIEHLENPRHFFREMHRILKSGGYGFVSTPYNLNLVARCLFLLKGQHRHFQDFSYPAHITPLLPVDISRLATETGFRILSVHYNYTDVLPLLKREIHIRHPLFSNSFGVLLKKK
jgi:2-polyprenyl-3-methyl-5-hydroxy-6-metoxy-1,4-benzoquinol methylase